MITETKLNNFIDDLQAFKEQMQKKYDVEIKHGKIRWSSDGFRFSTNASTITEIEQPSPVEQLYGGKLAHNFQLTSKAKSNFAKYGEEMGIDSALFGKIFQDGHGTKHVIVDWKPRSKKYPLITKILDGNGAGNKWTPYQFSRTSLASRKSTIKFLN